MALTAKLTKSIAVDHSDIVNDCQADFFRRRLATCSSDKTINIYDISKECPALITRLQGHEGPVWACGWSNPCFGTYLATCSYDKKVIIWKEELSEWQKDYVHVVHLSSVSCLEWSPMEHGLILACGSNDGSVSVITSVKEKWDYSLITGVDQVGVTCLCWGPPYIYVNENKPERVLKIATGGVEGLINIYSYQEGKWSRSEMLNGDQDSVRSVAWTTSEEGQKHHIASSYNNGSVIVWTKSYQTDREWRSIMLKQFSNPVWSVSWSEVGNLLSVSSGEEETSIWKRNLDETWTCITQLVHS